MTEGPESYEECRARVMADRRLQRLHLGLSPLVHAVTRDTEEEWADLPRRVMRFLAEHERGNIALAMLRSMPEDRAFVWAEAAFVPCEDLPVLFSRLDEMAYVRLARKWVGGQPQTALRAFAFAAFKSMDAETQRSFIRWCQDQARSDEKAAEVAGAVSTP